MPQAALQRLVKLAIWPVGDHASNAISQGMVRIACRKVRCGDGNDRSHRVADEKKSPFAQPLQKRQQIVLLTVAEPTQ